MSTGTPQGRNTSAVIHRSWLSSTVRNTGQTDNQKDPWSSVTSYKQYHKELELNARYWPRPGAKVTQRRSVRLTSCVLLGCWEPRKSQRQGFQSLGVHRALSSGPRGMSMATGVEGVLLPFPPRATSPLTLKSYLKYQPSLFFNSAMTFKNQSTDV